MEPEFAQSNVTHKSPPVFLYGGSRLDVPFRFIMAMKGNSSKAGLVFLEKLKIGYRRSIIFRREEKLLAAYHVSRNVMF